MDSPVPYDDWADVYPAWTDTAPITARNKAFYLEEYLRSPGPRVELGIGNGRIALEAIRRGRSMVGVDSSRVMLAACARRAEAEGLLEALTLIEADWRSFELPERAALITIPFHSVGHLVDDESFRTCFRNVRRQLKPDGAFVFDHFVFNEELARRQDGLLKFRAGFRDAAGRHGLLWQCSRFDFERQVVTVEARTDLLGDDGEVVGQRYLKPLQLAWLKPEQAVALLEETGFRIDERYGDFERGPFTNESGHQIYRAVPA